MFWNLESRLEVVRFLLGLNIPWPAFSVHMLPSSFTFGGLNEPFE